MTRATVRLPVALAAQIETLRQRTIAVGGVPASVQQTALALLTAAVAAALAGPPTAPVGH
jgi:hypothetical protein